MKLTGVLLLLVIGYCSAVDYRQCKEEDKKTLLGETSFSIDGRLFIQVVKYVEFPEDGGSLPSAIDCIIATDETDDKHSGTVELVEGGLSFNFTSLRFTSEFGKGMKYNVKIYSK